MDEEINGEVDENGVGLRWPGRATDLLCEVVRIAALRSSVAFEMP